MRLLVLVDAVIVLKIPYELTMDLDYFMDCTVGVYLASFFDTSQKIAWEE